MKPKELVVLTIIGIILGVLSMLIILSYMRSSEALRLAILNQECLKMAMETDQALVKTDTAIIKALNELRGW